MSKITINVGTMDPMPTCLLAAVLLGRNSPLAPHDAAAIRELLGERSDEDLVFFIQNGAWPVTT
jgi:hypothetical protein